MDLLRSTKIPGNHEKIISALYDLFIAYNNENDEEMEADEFNDLAESIREQKREAEEEARLKKEMEDRLLLEDAVE
ncbi:MAG: hypothetical protein KJ754_09230 [Bacteroidetes bacterium]|nr:hypothetical protein [Bacteroidota bacterium]